MGRCLSGKADLHGCGIIMQKISKENTVLVNRKIYKANTVTVNQKIYKVDTVSVK